MLTFVLVRTQIISAGQSVSTPIERQNSFKCFLIWNLIGVYLLCVSGDSSTWSSKESLQEDHFDEQGVLFFLCFDSPIF